MPSKRKRDGRLRGYSTSSTIPNERICAMSVSGQLRMRGRQKCRVGTKWNDRKEAECGKGRRTDAGGPVLFHSIAFSADLARS